VKDVLLVALGGALGTAARFGVGRAIGPWQPTAFPWATFTVNVIGCFLLGVIAEWAGDRRWLGVEVRNLLGVGVMGGFTTYSSFDLETLRLVQQGAPAMAAGYVAVTLVAGLAAGVAGLSVGRAIAP
jgi:CrcB protein